MPVMRYLPHIVQPSQSTVHLAIVYKDFGASRNISHIGLGVAATNNARILNAAGYWTEVWPLKTPADLRAKLGTARGRNLGHNQAPISHVCISAAWFPVLELAALARDYHEIDFTVTSHSNVGFLQADPNAFTILRGTGDLQTGATNIHLGANCRRLISWWLTAYHQPIRLLPNMYDLTAGPTTTQNWRGGHLLRIGCFGAVRPLKNLVTAGAAAIEIADRLQTDLRLRGAHGRRRVDRDRGSGSDVRQSAKRHTEAYRLARLARISPLGAQHGSAAAAELLGIVQHGDRRRDRRRRAVSYLRCD